MAANLLIQPGIAAVGQAQGTGASIPKGSLVDVFAALLSELVQLTNGRNGENPAMPQPAGSTSAPVDPTASVVEPTPLPVGSIDPAAGQFTVADEPDASGDARTGGGAKST